MIRRHRSFAHLRPGWLLLYTDTTKPPERHPLPGHPNEHRAKAETILHNQGLTLGIDGWRTPLRADSNLIATAQVIRIPERQIHKPRRP